LVDALHQRAGGRDDLRRRHGRGAELDERDEIGRVHRMRDEATLGVAQVVGERTRDDARGRARQHRRHRCRGVELGDERAFRVDGLRAAFLDVPDPIRRLNSVSPGLR